MTTETVAIKPINPEFDRLLKVAHAIYEQNQKKLSFGALISLATSLAVEVNSVASLPGSLKKQLVIDVVKALLDEAVKESTEKLAEQPELSDDLKALASFVENALPVVLDTLIAVARGKIDLKKIVPQKLSWPKWTSCFACCVPSLVKVAEPAALSIRVPEKVESHVVVTSDLVPPVDIPVAEAAPVPEQSIPQVEVIQVKLVDTETPQQNSTETVNEVPSVVEVSPPTLPEKSESE